MATVYASLRAIEEFERERIRSRILAGLARARTLWGREHRRPILACPIEHRVPTARCRKLVASVPEGYSRHRRDYQYDICDIGMLRLLVCRNREQTFAMNANCGRREPP